MLLRSLARFGGIRVCTVAFLLLSWQAAGYLDFPRRGHDFPTVPEWAHRFPTKQDAGCGDYRRWDLGRLQLEAGWKSQQPRYPHDITLVTQASMSRLHMLEASCQTWTGVIAIAVHVPLLKGQALLESGKKTNLTGVVERLARLNQRLEQAGSCRVDMALFSEEVDARVFSFLYPVNALRNRALMLADTKVVLLLDVDFVVSTGLSQPGHYPELERQVLMKQAIVLPAFKPLASELNAKGFGQKVGTWDKSTIETLCREGRMMPFRENRLHDATNYGQWLLTNMSYDIAFHEGYEPYVVVAREFVPWYDERFRGYFANKQLQLHHFFRLGFKFVAHPSEFVVHYPHNKSKSKVAVKLLGLYPKPTMRGVQSNDVPQRLQRSLKELSENLAVKGMYWEAMLEMEEGKYQPVTSFSCPRDAQSTLLRGLYLYSSVLVLVVVLVWRVFGLCFCPLTAFCPISFSP